jgi:RpiB/LacA/LacB family sugar-phosphate isomerase
MLYIASDHGGYQLKKYLVKYLTNQLKIEVQDLGPKEHNEDDDFPTYAIPLSQQVASEPDSLGILICRTGHGMCIVANKIKGIRAIMGYSIEAAEKGRSEENANILCLAGGVLTEEHAAAAVKHFLEATFDKEERRIRRLKQIEEIEK